MHTITHTALKLVLMTNAIKTKFETEMINRFFAEGLDELHIHKPDFQRDDFIAFIEKIDAEHHSKLVLHDSYGLVNSYNIHKIHLGREWSSNMITDFYLDRMLLRGKKVAKTICVSSCEDIYKNTQDADEIILGPVYTRSMYTRNNQAIKTEDLARVTRHSKVPVLGLGGANPETIGTFRDAGFSGIVLQTSIWNNTDPVRAFIQMRDLAQVQDERTLRIAI